MEEDNGSMVSPAETEMQGDTPGRNSIDKPTSSKRGENIIPHYLRASTGSCHDFCKFGRQHTFDAKARRSMPKQIKEVLASPEKILPVVLPAKPLSVSKSFDSSEKYSRSKSAMKREIVNDGKPLMAKTRPSISSKISSKMEIPSSSEKCISTRKNVLSGRESKLPAKSHTLSKTKSEKVNSSTSTNIVAGKLGRNRDLGTGRMVGKSNIASKKLPAKSETFSKTKSEKVNWSTSTNIGAGKLGRNRDLGTGRMVGKFNIASKKVSSSLSPKPVNRIANLNARKQKSRKVGSPRVSSSGRTRKDESNKDEYDEVEEKTLYVIKIETEKKPPVSSSSFSPDEHGDRDEGENTANEAEYDSFSEVENIKKMVDKKGRLKKLVSPRPSKLSFRRGKVVEIQSQTNTPRRLKFRPARLLGEQQKIVDPRRRNIKKVEEFESETINGEKSGEQVVLRHQDMEGKKDSRGLFNNVIEETASKLVETQKSKVKALVGAFETVISLQEIKASARSAA